jgi:heptosyltransferase II
MADRILVIRFSSVGDIVLTEPVVRVLRERYPSATISYLTKTKFLPLLDMFEGISHTLGWTDDRDSAVMIERLRDGHFDLVVDLHASIRSARVRSALGTTSVRTKKEWFKRMASVKLHAIAGKPSHAVERYFAPLRELGIESAPQAPILHVPSEAGTWWQRQLTSSALPKYYVIAAGAAHITKRAPESLWIGLDRSIRMRLGLSPLLLGAPSEREYLTNLAARLDEPSLGVVTEDDIRRAAAVIKSAAFVLSNDSGLSHIAAALGTPVVALFGPTHPVLGFSPMGVATVSYTIDEYCSPCSLHGDRRCHRSERFCFTKMRLDGIVDEISALLKH